MKRALYDGLGRLLYPLGLAAPGMGSKAAVAVFHRIDDRYPGNPITAGRAEFRAYCEFFARYFDVITVTELLDRMAQGRPIGGTLAITFDDGYLDNHAVAAEELDRRGLPACFFICTGFIGSNRSAPWDEKAGIRSEWMQWDDVRDLARRGFEIGAHTVTHPDLGVIGPAEAEREVADSRARLEAEIGRPVDLFCYPFGGPAQLSEPNREVIRRLGMRCCFSCYGGTIHAGDDPLRLERAPISPWHRTPHQYGFELLASIVRGRVAYG